MGKNDYKRSVHPSSWYLVLNPRDNDSLAIQHAMNMANEIDRSKSRIILSTPHGITASHDFSVYLNSKGSGSADWEDNYREYSINVKLDTMFSSALVSHLEVNNSVSGITAHNPGVPIPLRWGEVIPLIYMSSNADNFLELLLRYLMI